MDEILVAGRQAAESGQTVPHHRALGPAFGLNNPKVAGSNAVPPPQERPATAPFLVSRFRLAH